MYRSGMLVKLYRESGGRFSGDKTKNAPLNRWFSEGWGNQKVKSDISIPVISIDLR